MYPYCLVSSSGLVATFTDKEAKLWDCKTFKEIKKFGGHEEEVFLSHHPSLSFAPRIITLSFYSFVILFF